VRFRRRPGYGGVVREFIENPRRTPRAPARCRVGVVAAGGAFEAATEDLGAHGCRLASPQLVRKGEPVQLALEHGGVRRPLRVHASIAWTSETSPWRLGVAFDRAAHAESGRWFSSLLAAVPGLGTERRVPERIAADARVYLGAPPRRVVDLSRAEADLLRAIGPGRSVVDLRGADLDGWQARCHVLFSLLAQRHATLARGTSVHPDAWRPILGAAPAPPDAARRTAPGTSYAPPMLPPESWARPRAALRTEPPPWAPLPAPGARALLAEALVLLTGGERAAAAALLRRAIALSPHDAEIATALALSSGVRGRHR
jgi:hypothetical protein